MVEPGRTRRRPPDPMDACNSSGRDDDMFQNHVTCESDDDLLFDEVDLASWDSYKTSQPVEQCQSSDACDGQQVATPVPTEQTENVGSSTKDIAIAKIENIFSKLTASLISGDEGFRISLVPRPKSKQSPVKHSKHAVPTRHINFPGTTALEAWRFTVFIRALELMHEALIDDVVITKRDMYYRDPALFGRQSVVDRIVDDIAYSFGVSRSSLNVIAAAKGLVSGKLTFTKNDGTHLDASTNTRGLLIPMIQDDYRVDATGAKWIIVVEKEAVFQSLLSSGIWRELSKKAIAITGKGYPDIATRILLKEAASEDFRESKSPPIVLGLVDYDPDGVGILSTYKHGSATFPQQENEKLRVPSIRWLGICSRDLCTKHGYVNTKDLLRLSARDRRKASLMLGWSDFDENTNCKEWRTELQIMLMLNFKAEIEILASAPGGLETWLMKRLYPS